VRHCNSDNVWCRLTGNVLYKHIWTAGKNESARRNRFALHADINNSEIGFLKKREDLILTVWFVQQLVRQGSVHG